MEEEKKAMRVIGARSKRLAKELEIEFSDNNINPLDEPKINYLMQEINANNTVLKLIQTQDKMINLMAGRIVELLEEKNITNHSKKDVIDTFKNLAVNNLLKEVNEDAKNS